MSLLRVIGRVLLIETAVGAFGWPYGVGTHTTLGTLAAGVLLSSAVSPAVPRAGGWRERRPDEL